MKFITIDKKDWACGIENSKKTYELFGPVKDKDDFIIKKLGHNILPEMDYDDSVMSAKSVIFPQTEKILMTTLDESQEDHHIMKKTGTNYLPRAVVGIRPYDAKAMQIINLNFDNDNNDYKDPYWRDAYAATTFVGLGLIKPGSCDFSTSANSGPFCEDGLDILLADLDDKYLAKILTDKGEAFMASCKFNTESDEKEGQILFDILRKEAEKNITSKIKTDNLKNKNYS